MPTRLRFPDGDVAASEVDDPERLARAKEATVALTKKLGKRFRFSVQRADGRSSGLWSVWQSKDDLYLANKTLGGAQKVSLHAQGGYRYAITKEHFGELIAAGRNVGTRDFVVWERAEPPHQGAKLVLSLTFPISRLRHDPHVGKANKPIMVFGAEGAETGAVQFGFFSSREPAEALEEKFLELGVPIWRWELSDGSSITMVLREMEFDESSLPSPSNPHRVQLTLGNEERLAISKNLTALFWNDPTDGCLFLIEVGGLTLTRS